MPSLAGSLADPSLWPRDAAGTGLLLVVRGRQACALARPEEWRTVREVLAEAGKRTPELRMPAEPVAP
ncbi:hypothetical protein GCM10009549_23220 [Streptomyces thermoalcalitolerans]|uniref:Uncharacterized protein n=1 Tax=Streptomyces thermoalcalitolerans TaxID=65605 RepID=A0ABN1NLA7_9ACTN